MIRQALFDKFRARGALGFALDSGKEAIGYYYVAGMAFTFGSAAIAGVVVALPIMAATWVGELAEYRER